MNGFSYILGKLYKTDNKYPFRGVKGILKQISKAEVIIALGAGKEVIEVPIGSRGFR